MRYRNLSGYLKEKYGARVRKICIDGGFSCPNRDGRCGTGGCIYCSERGSGEHIEPSLSIREQVLRALSSATEKDLFIAYFQNFTNTYAEPSVLKERYDSALIDKRIVCLAIGTRPDCITEEIAALISSYRERVDVWVELGLQTASDKTAAVINRGYKTEVYFEAMRILAKYGIPAVTHLMIGLPGEGDSELRETVSAINITRPFGIKLHSVYVAEGTMLAGMYRRGEYQPIERDTYIERAAYVIRNINPETVIHRLTGDCPPELLVAPMWNRDKNAVIQGINDRLSEENAYQGYDYH